MEKIPSKILRKFGFKNDREGIMQRYLREVENWKSHIENTKKFILKSAETKDKKLCVVLGSGWWLDVPAEELCTIFEEVIFIDITHSSQIQHKAKKYKNLQLLNADVTGLIEKIYENRKLLKKQELNITDLFLEDYNFGLPENINPDFYVSVNILSQISYFITEYLKKNKVENNEDKLSEIKKLIEEHHINMLPQGKSCLVVDYFEKEYDFSDVLKSSRKRVDAELPNVVFSEKWKWKFDMTGNFKLKSKLVFNVLALDF